MLDPTTNNPAGRFALCPAGLPNNDVSGTLSRRTDFKVGELLARFSPATRSLQSHCGRWFWHMAASYAALPHAAKPG